MGLSSLIADPSIPDDVKIAVLRKKGMSQSLAERAVTATSGERTYEKFERDPARKVLSYLPGGKTIGDYAIPSDLQSLDETIGGGIGTAVGHPFVGAELGGALGGMAQGRGAGESALRAAPGAAANLLIPKILQWLMKNQIARSMSNKASGAIAKAAKKLLTKLDTSDLEPTPNGLLNFFGSGNASVGVQRAGAELGHFRNILRTQPAFMRLHVQVPIRNPAQQVGANFLVNRNPLGSVGWHMMPFDEAMDYLDQLYGRANAPSGNPRGGVWAEPDRQLAAWTRQGIIKAIRTVSPRYAQQFTDLSRDYGITKAMGDVLTKDAIDTSKGLLNHQKIYDNAADKKVMNHLNALVGDQDARSFLADIVPGRKTITESSGGPHFSAGVPGVPGLHARPSPGFFSGPPTGPQAFTPAWPKVVGPVSSQAATQEIEGQQ